MRIIGTCNVDVRGGVEDRGYALERAVMELVALRGSTAGGAASTRTGGTTAVAARPGGRPPGGGA
jgi:hypothetical protein